MEIKGNTENTVVEGSGGNTSPAKKSKAKMANTQRSKASHPPTSKMVNVAIRELKDPKGSSIQAIKKYITSTFKVDGEKIARYIKKYLKEAVISGAVVQTKGKGASGSFKLSTSKNSEPKVKDQKSVKATEPKKEKKSVEKKTTPTRKPATSKKPSPAKKTEKMKAKKSPASKKAPAKAEKIEETKKAKPASESKTMSKTKKMAKAPAAKTKTPKPKKSVPTRAVRSATKK